MTDLLESQAEARARNQPIRDRSGQFIRPSRALEIKIAAERMKARLLRDTKAAEHARGVVWEGGHYHKLPNADRMAVASAPAPVLPLFELEAA